MTAEPLYSASSDAISTHLEGEAVVLHMGSRRYFRLNETAAEVWAELDRGGVRPSELVARLCEEFQVRPEEAQAEVARLLRELEARELIVAAGAP